MTLQTSSDTSCQTDPARSAITDALHLYCTAVDSYNTELFLTLWTVDASLDFGKRYCGPPSGFIDSIIDTRGQTSEMSHAIETVHIEIAADALSAESRSVVCATVARVSPEGNIRRKVRGIYKDRWILSEDRWLIQHRHYQTTEETKLS